MVRLIANIVSRTKHHNSINNESIAPEKKLLETKQTGRLPWVIIRK